MKLSLIITYLCIFLCNKVLAGYIPKRIDKSYTPSESYRYKVPDTSSRNDRKASSNGDTPYLDSHTTEKKIQQCNARTAKILAYHAALAGASYCRTIIYKQEWSCGFCDEFGAHPKLIYTFHTDEYDMQGYILRDEQNKVIHLVFRGSSSLRNFISDAEFTKVEYPHVSGSLVHQGFYYSYMDTAPEVVPIMQREMTAHPDYTFDITGHSLGSAVAMFSALDLYQTDQRFTAQNMNVYSYGGPRIGNSVFAHYFASTGIPVKRTVHKADVVPHLPAEDFGFLHFGPEYWIEKDGELPKVCNDNLETNDCSNSIMPFTRAQDHLLYFRSNTGTCQ
ncbi:Alpha/Beta hydrolase protein [Spinellus fusiger]|nr:Alpha/Beta hydrolase protein [Spinellus fusiger]